MQVPPAWLKTYPSLKPLGPGTRDLLQRLDQLRSWIDKGYPVAYWLAGFTYPTAFLTAVLQVLPASTLHTLCLTSCACLAESVTQQSNTAHSQYNLNPPPPSNPLCTPACYKAAHLLAC